MMFNGSLLDLNFNRTHSVRDLVLVSSAVINVINVDTYG